MVTDQIADLLTRIRNASRMNHVSALIPASRTKESILNVLLEEGYIASVEATTDANEKPALRVGLRFDQHGSPVIRGIDRISKPGRRIYVKKGEIPVHKSGLGTIVVSTSQGMLSDKETRKRGVGGELVCSVF